MWPSTDRRDRAVYPTALAVALALFLALAIATSIATGTRTLAIADLAGALSTPGDSTAATIVWAERIPRTLLALGIGAAFGGAGSILRTVTGNPLAEPGVLGIGAGAALAIVVAIGWLGPLSLTARTWIGVGGAALAASVVLARSLRFTDRLGTLLTGFAMTALCTGATSVLALRDRAAFDSLRGWMVGSTATHGYTAPLIVGVCVTPSLLAALILVPSLDIQAFGHDLAKSLGARVGLTRTAAFGLVTVLAGVATAVAGPYLFVGLVSAHLAHHARPSGGRRGLLLASAVGAVLVLTADILGRLIGPNGEVPGGLIAATIGAPALIIAYRVGRGGR